VNQQNVYSARHHELLDALNVRLAVVDANEVKRFAPQLDGRSLLAQNADTFRGKQSGDGFFGLGDRLMVPEAAEYAVRCTKTRERLDHIPLRCGVPGEVVPSQHNQVGFQLVGYRDAATVNSLRLLDSYKNFKTFRDETTILKLNKTEADLLVILTDVDGLYTAEPSSAAARLIPLVAEITPEIEDLAREPSPASKVGRGGIRTKIEAARIAARSGCATVIAGGKLPGILTRIFAGEEVGTLFLPQTGLPGKRRWIAFATTVKAALVVNEGARRALVERKASLLAAGVTEVRGAFERGDVVSVIDEREQEFARGIVNYSSDEARRITGQHSAKIDELIENRNYDALITRDNIAFLEKR